MNLSEYLEQFKDRSAAPIWLDLRAKDFRDGGRSQSDVLYTRQDWALSDLVTITEDNGMIAILKNRHTGRMYPFGYRKITRPAYLIYDLETD